LEIILGGSRFSFGFDVHSQDAANSIEVPDKTDIQVQTILNTVTENFPSLDNVEKSLIGMISRRYKLRESALDIGHAVFIDWARSSWQEVHVTSCTNTDLCGFLRPQ